MLFTLNFQILQYLYVKENVMMLENPILMAGNSLPAVNTTCTNQIKFKYNN